MLARADLLHVHRPAALPHARIDLRLDSGTRHRIPDLRAEDPGEDVPGQEKAPVSGPDPRGAISGQATRGHEEMGVRMILQGAGPRVEHGEDARGAADPLPI